MMQEVLIDQRVVIAKMHTSELDEVPLQADSPDILILESTGGLLISAGL